MNSITGHLDLKFVKNADSMFKITIAKGDQTIRVLNQPLKFYKHWVHDAPEPLRPLSAEELLEVRISNKPW